MAEAYWIKTFEGLETTHYPPLPVIGYQPTLNRSATHEIRGLDLQAHPDAHRTLSTTLRAAWALLLAQYSGTNDVVFGAIATSHNRDLVAEDQDEPSVRERLLLMRVKIDWQSNANEWLREIASQETAMEAVQSWGGLDQIRLCSPKAQEACNFGSLLHIQYSGTSHSQESRGLEAEKEPLAGQLALLVECLHGAGTELQLQFHFDSNIMDQTRIRRMAFQYEHIIRQVLSLHSSTCGDLSAKRIVELDTFCEQDKALVWSWNASVPRKVSARVPHLFSLQVSSKPQSLAVHAWDGSLTYAELDRKSNALCAWLLRQNIASAGRIVPVCFDKTIWTTITILAIAKSGSVFILLDPNQPQGRLATILNGLEFTGVLARPDTVELAQSLANNVHLVGEELIENELLQRKEAEDFQNAAQSPDDPLYIVFTSGSTGTPKGVTISHANLCTAAAHQARALGFDGSRTFDSSSYSFDAYVCNTFYTLLTGGCLCVPSETDRINNLQSVLQEMEVDFVQLTPSTTRVLDPAKLPRLHTLILTGEKISRSVLDPWLATGRVRVINAYGPSECTIMCSANRNITCIEDAECIGNGLGAVLWVADVNDITKLAPVGAVGELLIEGHIIGQGYLGDEAKTRESLVHVPNGYLQGVADAPSGHLFRTKDLARYNSDGSIVYLGRADTQIKVNGQRVEIGEVEYNLGQCLPEGIDPIVETVQWPSGKRQLLGFVYLGAGHAHLSLQHLIAGLDAELSKRLPRYMIPSAYFPLREIPMTASGKTDRKKLRSIALDAPHQLLDGQTSNLDVEDRPMTTKEQALSELWAKTLAIDQSSIRPKSNFFSQGGDSLAAMRLVATLQREGYYGTTVAHIFQHPHLSDLATILTKKDCIEEMTLQSDIAPFSMLGGYQDVAGLRNQVSELCQCPQSHVVDIYPCSPIQEEMVILASRNPEGFVTQKVVALPPNANLSRVMSVLGKLTATIPILCTRIVDIEGATSDSPNLVQAVIKGGLPVTPYSHLETCLQHERAKDMGLGKPLFRLASVQAKDSVSSGNGEAFIVLTMHHAVYDGWFLDILGEELTRAYQGKENTTSIIEYRNFISYLNSSDDAEIASFWQRTLKDVEPADYPSFPAPDYKPKATAVLECEAVGIDWTAANGITANTLVQAAWAVVLSKYSGAEDVVFGSTLLGRQIPLPGIERIGGPTIATVPVRVIVGWDSQTVAQFLQAIQTQSVEVIPFMHFGIKNIRQLSYDADRACRFRTFLVVQPASEPSGNDMFDLGSGKDDIQAFNTYAVMLECSLTKYGVKMRSSFDNSLVNDDVVRSMMGQMSRVLKLFCTEDQSIGLGDLEILNGEERQRILNFKSNAQHSQILEIASHFRSCLPQEVSDSTVHILEICNVPKQLVGVLCLPDDSQRRLLDILSEAHSQLTKILPKHMIPTKFILSQSIPRKTGGDVDGDALGKLATETPAERVIDASLLRKQIDSHQQPQTSAEILLQGIWAKVLGINASSIGRESSFLFLGGDSLAAMRLVSMARHEGYSLTVAKIFQAPRLQEMAANAVERINAITNSPLILPFSLMDGSFDKESLAKACNIEPEEIEDAYPCTPLQEAVMARTTRRAGDFVSQGLTQLAGDIDIERLRYAWETVAAATPILRTRIVECPGHGLLQVVVKGAITWSVWGNLDDVASSSLGLGQPLLRFDLIESSQENKTSRALLTTIHHAIHDRWSASLILEQVEAVYKGQERNEKLMPYNYFINYLKLKDKEEELAEAFWTNYYSDLDVPNFPSLPTPKYQPRADGICKRQIQIQWPSNATPSTTLKATWSILLAQYSNSNDVVFGLTVMGRQAPLAGIELVAGPTIATLPFRAKIEWAGTPRALLQAIQTQATQMIPFEHYGLGQLSSLSPEAKRACQFQSALVIQPPERSTEHGELFGLGLSDSDAQGADGNALVLECTLNDRLGEVEVNLNFDRQILDGTQAERMLAQFEHLLRQFSMHDLDIVSLKDLATLNQQDCHQIWAWNATVPEKMDKGVSDMILERVHEQPNATAVCSWDGSLSYSELHKMAQGLAYSLVVQHGVEPETVVPICFEKSLWAPVAMLAIVLAGGTVVAMDPSQPFERLHSIAEQVQARLILASATTKNIAQKLVTAAIVINSSSICGLPEPPPSFATPVISGTNALYINFTSGSTGTPKGAIVTHENFSSAVHHQANGLGFGKTTRALDLASYSFDVVWELFFQLLCTGGCLCIPSDDDRRNDIAGSIQRLNVNLLDTTPSIARTLDPTAVPSLKKIVLGGEPLAVDDVIRWENRPDVEVCNTYGPTECTPTSTIAVYGQDFTSEVSLGRCYGLNSWIVSCNGGVDDLVPIGAIGELVLEGPLVGRGYLNDPDRTAVSFIQDPSWLLRGHPGSNPGRHGRMYKTGDLVKYDSRGMLTFVGRKDTQVKIRGQRVELEEIEFHARSFLGSSFSVAAEVIEMDRAAYKSQVLALFLSREDSQQPDEQQEQQQHPASSTLTSDLADHLSQVLPIYMVPSTFIFAKIQLSASGKIDRRRLREIGAQAKLDQLHQRRPGTGPETKSEKDLCQLWSETLGVPLDSLGRNHSFFDIGGDSLSAIRLVGTARKQGLPLSVAMIFQYPRLDEMARELVSAQQNVLDKTSADDSKIHSLIYETDLPDPAEVSKLLSVSQDAISDILPVTEFQSYALKCALGKPRTEWNYFLARFSRPVDTARLQRVSQQLTDTVDIFRAIFLAHGRQYVQVFLKFLEPQVDVVKTSEPLDAICNAVCLQDLNGDLPPIGSSLAKFYILQTEVGELAEETSLLIRIPHVLYDGIGFPLLADSIGALCDQRPLPPLSNFSTFIKDTARRPTETYEFWGSVLKDSAVPTIISPKRACERSPSQGKRLHLLRDISLPQHPPGVTAATILSAAWGVALSRVTGATDVVFGRAVSGRTLASAAAEHHQDVIGPCFNLVPVRMMVNPSDSIHDILYRLQDQIVASIPHEHMGLSEMVDRYTSWPKDTVFGSVVYYQNLGDDPTVTIDGHMARLTAVPLDRPDPPEPPRLDIIPKGDKQYTLELMVHEEDGSAETSKNLLDEMENCLELFFKVN
ncbi:nonribosomal peptide synthase 11 [Ilyonectria robusta]|uniref:nonribosomal peptide synthase 11 n=1 Tax=Ilyonectria robusta TaxID=1079257 RepID=UPI001E8E4CEB|nr:nonribosomal peptide synthase 11 [Ilyonectria robusta]KAH8736477.1 nonribosomal peptide synthase 11 [Ilyonectria robusta]